MQTDKLQNETSVWKTW